MCKCGVAMDRATIQCPTVGTVTGVEYPVPRNSGTADQSRGAEAEWSSQLVGLLSGAERPYLLGLGSFGRGF